MRGEGWRSRLRLHGEPSRGWRLSAHAFTVLRATAHTFGSAPTRRLRGFVPSPIVWASHVNTYLFQLQSSRRGHPPGTRPRLPPTRDGHTDGYVHLVPISSSRAPRHISEGP